MRKTDRMIKSIATITFAVAMIACNNNTPTENNSADTTVSFIKGSYGYDAGFLKKHTANVVELSNDDGSAKVLLSADFQGRVMTSTATGDSGTSYGWMKYDLIESAKKLPHMNAFGGEERFWLGPEGGQYSIYFKGRDSFVFNNWQVPAVIDTISYDVTQSGKSKAVFTKQATLTNYSGTVFSLNIERSVSLLSKQEAEAKINASIPSSVHFVGFETENKITNTGERDWTKDSGLLSIWLLGMFTPSPKTTVIIPFHALPNAKSFITDNYFGTVPAERLQVKDSVLFFTCDGKYRSKIGLSPVIAKPIAGSFDFEKNVLTLVLPQVDKNAAYVNSKWEIQKEPYKGDVINSYNDGPLADGTQMGPFYEIESSSPALELQKGATGIYKQTTMHLQGDYNALNTLAKQLLGIDLDTIKK